MFAAHTASINATELQNEEYIEKNQGSLEEQERNSEILKEKDADLSISLFGWGDTIRPQMKIYEQENEYYCGPANVKIVLQSINGSSYSQGTYAYNMGTSRNYGTYVYRLVNELNAQLSVTSYAYAYIGSSSRQYLMDRLVSDIKKNYPVILHADTRPLYMYYGNSLGHYLTVDSVIADGSDLNKITRVGYLDPFYEDYGRGKVFGSWTESFENIFQSVLDRYLIW